MPTRRENDREKIIEPYMACFKGYGSDIRSVNAGTRNTLETQRTADTSTGDLKNTLAISSRYER